MNITERIQLLEGAKIESLVPHQPAQHFGARWGFVKVLSIARPPERSGTVAGSLFQAQQAFTSGLYAASCPWGFLVTGDAASISVWFALPGSGDVRSIWEPRLSSCFPCSQFSGADNPEEIERRVSALGHVVTLTGNPSVGGAGRESPHPQAMTGAWLETLVRNMGGRHFAYVVLARPVALDVVQDAFDWLADEERELVSNFQRRDINDDLFRQIFGQRANFEFEHDVFQRAAAGLDAGCFADGFHRDMHGDFFVCGNFV